MPLKPFLLALALLAASPALADSPVSSPPPRPAAPDIAAQKAAMARAGWLVGAWEGRGWVDTESGRLTFRQTEAVETRLDGALLVIEGRGYAGAPETLMFNAFGVLSHDDRTGRAAFRSYTRGYAMTADAEIRPDGAIVWRMTPPGQIIRYTITQPRPDVWLEVGERSTDGGATFTQTFQMELTRRR